MATIDYFLERAEKVTRHVYFLAGAINFDKYSTGGISLEDATRKFHHVMSVFLANTGGYLFEYDANTNKVKALYPVSATKITDNALPNMTAREVPNKTDMEGVSVDFVIYGIK